MNDALVTMINSGYRKLENSNGLVNSKINFLINMKLKHEIKYPTVHFKRKKLSNNSSWDFEYVLHTSDTY